MSSWSLMILFLFRDMLNWDFQMKSRVITGVMETEASIPLFWMLPALT